MIAPKCKLCGSNHYSYEPHKFAINTESAINDAINRSDPPSVERKPSVVSNTKVSAAEGSGRTANRRTKEAYNAYMKDYMRKKRAGLQEV